MFNKKPKLTYAESAKCPCGARLAYRSGDKFWDCSAILLGEAIPSGQPGSVQHTDRLYFQFYKVKEEK